MAAERPEILPREDDEGAESSLSRPDLLRLYRRDRGEVFKRGVYERILREMVRPRLHKQKQPVPVAVLQLMLSVF